MLELIFGLAAGGMLGFLAGIAFIYWLVGTDVDGEPNCRIPDPPTLPPIPPQGGSGTAPIQPVKCGPWK